MPFNVFRLSYLLTGTLLKGPSSALIWATSVFQDITKFWKRKTCSIFSLRKTLESVYSTCQLRSDYDFPTVFNLINKTNDLILNLTPENVTQHSRIVTTTRKGSSTPTKMSKIIGRHCCSINLDCCIKTCEYFIFTIKENCLTDNYEKFGKDRNRSYRIMFIFSLISYNSNWANYALGWGFCFPFSTRGPKFCTEKLSPGRGLWGKKLVARGLAPGGDGNRSNWYMHNTYT